jgi:hypothetical protein
MGPILSDSEGTPKGYLADTRRPTCTCYITQTSFRRLLAHFPANPDHGLNVKRVAREIISGSLHNYVQCAWQNFSGLASVEGSSRRNWQTLISGQKH